MFQFFTTNFTTNHYHYSPPPTTFSVPMRNIGKSCKRHARILRGLQRFGNNLGGVGAAGVVLRVWF